MGKYLLLLAIFLSMSLNAQNDSSLYDFDFSQKSIKDILISIESHSEITFYFQDSWFESDELMTRNYSKKTIDYILDDILKETDFNFFVLEQKKIIITKNTAIYNELPEGFFGKKVSEIKINPPLPVFVNNASLRKNKTIRIGKFDKTITGKNEFIVTVYIKSIQTDRPMANINVLVNGIKNDEKTDENGKLNLKLTSGSYNIEFDSELIENSKIDLLVYNDGVFTISVNEDVEQLKEVIIDGKAKSILKDAISKTSIDVEKSKNIPLVLGERDILKVSTSLPGITTAGEGATGYNVRGGKTDQNLILLDNATIYNPQHFFGLFSGLNPFAVGTVDIYKSGIPSRYGGRLSSVFDLKTKDSTVEEFSGEASLGPVTGNVLLETPVIKSKSGLLIGGRGAYADWILKELDSKSLKNSKASFFDVVAKYNHKITKKAKLATTAYWSTDNFNVTTDSVYNYSNKLLTLKWDQKINKKHNASLNLSNSDYTFGIEFDGLSNNDFKFNYGINETDIKVLFKYLYNSNLKFEYGVSSKLYDINPGEKEALNEDSIIESISIDKEKGAESALFISSNIDVTEKLNIDAGVRYSIFNSLNRSNQFIKTYANPELRLSTRYSINDNLSIKIAYGRTVQYIHTLSNNTTASPIDIWKLSDLNIEPQSSNQYSLGVYQNLKEDMYEVSLEGFYKKSNNVLDFKTGADIFLNQEIENEILQGEGKSYGVEFLLKKNIGRFNGWLSYTYSRSLIKFASEFAEEEINNGNFFSSNYDKPHDLSIIANYKFTQRYSISSNLAYQSGRPVTFPVGTFNFNNSEFTVYSDRNKFRIPDYYRLDIGFNIEGNHKLNKIGHSFWTISVYNVLGRNNPFSVFFVTQEGEVKAFQSSIFSVPVPSITYNFKF